MPHNFRPERVRNPPPLPYSRVCEVQPWQRDVFGIDWDSLDSKQVLRQLVHSRMITVPQSKLDAAAPVLGSSGTGLRGLVTRTNTSQRWKENHIVDLDYDLP